MTKILTFKHPDDDTPHTCGWLACGSCGYVAMHAWPQGTPLKDLECSECAWQGMMEVWNRAELLPMNEEWRAEIEAEGVRGEDE